VDEPVLSLQKLRKSFGALVVTDDVTFDLMPCELHAVIGPNGAGKTTLINQISGLVAPDSACPCTPAPRLAWRGRSR